MVVLTRQLTLPAIPPTPSPPLQYFIMFAFRHKMEIALLIFLIFIAFASAASPTTMWVQWTTLAVVVFFGLIFDMAFTDDSSFVFDPDADNWRRKTER